MTFRPPRRNTVVAVAVALAVIGWGVQPASARSRTPASVNGAARTAEQVAGVQRITADDLARLMRQGDVVIVDVRPHQSYQQAHLPDAVSIPLDQLERAVARLRATNASIVLYCGGSAGTKSGRAAALLREHGIDRVYCLDGGLDAWIGSGRVVIVDPGLT